MFTVPKTAGGHPRLVLTLASLAIAAAALAALANSMTPTAAPAQTAVAADRLPVVVVEDLPQLTARMAGADRFTGAVLVAKGDQVLFRQAYGMADREQGRAMALDTRFRLASLSKQFTAAAILKLQDQGKLSISDPICRWIQPCPDGWAPVTLDHLLSHTSGIPDLMQRPNWGLVRVTPQTPDELTAGTMQYRPSFPPGSRIRYSNAGYNLLGTVVERASGQSLQGFLQTEIFDPLGMVDTGYGEGVGLAMGYANFPAGITPQPDANVSIVFAAGALYSTVDDILAWSRALHHGRVLGARSYAEMIAPHNPADSSAERGRPARGYGYGIFSSPLGDRVAPAFYDRQIYHTGSWSGFRNLTTYQPETDVTVIVLSNNYHQREEVFLISQQAIAEALGRPFPTSMAR